jgi:alkylation response protein AidB-like acyl-CoA dehydrogenase
MMPTEQVREAHGDLVESFRRFLHRRVRPLAADLPPGGVEAVPDEVRRAVRRTSAQHGFYAADFPEDVGGQGLDQVGMARLRISAARDDCALGQLAVAGPEGPSQALLAATPQQRERYLRPLVEGRIIRCLALTEPDAGSDAAGIRSRARRVAGGWVIDGRKTFVTNGAEADVALVVARTDGEAPGAVGTAATTFLVDRGTPGYQPVRRIPCMWEGDARWEVVLEGCFVPDGQVLGGPEAVGSGLLDMFESLAYGRVAIAALCVGLGYRALRYGVDYARARTAFGRRIGEYQHVQQHLVEAHVRLRAAELLVLDAAGQLDAQDNAAAAAATAKLAASEWAFAAADGVLQVLGGIGYARDLPVEELVRQLRLYRIVDGTSELQKVIVARELLRL